MKAAATEADEQLRLLEERASEDRAEQAEAIRTLGETADEAEEAKAKL